MSNAQNKTQEKIAALFDARIASLDAVAKASSIVKLQALKIELIAESAFFSDNRSVSLDFINDTAIYAMQKIALIARSINTARDVLDSHTRALFRNQRALAHRLSNEQCNASLSVNIAALDADALTQRNKVHTTTATTQASSSRHALAVCKAATLEKHAIAFDVDSKVYQALDALIAQ